MKIVPLSKDDSLLLKAAHMACQDAETALDKAHKSNKAAQSDYADLCKQLCLKYKLDGQASDDQLYLYGHQREGVSTELATEPLPIVELPLVEPAPVEPVAPVEPEPIG